MKKILLALAILCSGLIQQTDVSATTQSLLSTQTQYYTVQLRSDQQALVYARIIFENSSATENMTNYTFKAPDGVSLENLSVQQILRKNTGKATCKTYETIGEWRARVSKQYSYTLGDSSYESTKICLEENAPQVYDDDFNYTNSMSSSTAYYSYSYYGSRQSDFDYINVDSSADNSTYTVNLSRAVKPKKQGSILLSFTTRDFVSKGMLGRYTYDVKTLLTNEVINKTTVAINFDNDMYTRAAEQKRTYSSDSATTSTAASGANVARVDSGNESTDAQAGNIGRGGIYVKEQSSLLPGDMLNITGVFATNKLVLFTNEILIGIVSIIVLVTCWFIYRRWRKKHPKKAPTSAQKSGPENTLSAGSTSIETVAPWKYLIMSSVASIVVTILIVAGMASMSNTQMSTMNSAIATVGLAVAVLFSSVIAPLLYVLRYGILSAFRFVLIHLVIIVLMLFGIVFFTTSDNSSLSSYDDYCINC